MVARMEDDLSTRHGTALVYFDTVKVRAGRDLKGVVLGREAGFEPADGRRSIPVIAVAPRGVTGRQLTPYRRAQLSQRILRLLSSATPSRPRKVLMACG
jgi:hypothetical protein